MIRKRQKLVIARLKRAHTPPAPGRRLSTRALGWARDDTGPLVILGLAILASTVLCLRETRGSTFGADEYWYFIVNRGFNVKGLLSPHNGNLIAVIRLLYATVFKLFGTDYLPFRILEVVGIGLNSALVFILVRRRVGAVAALVPAILILFQGASPDVALSPLGITHVYCVAAGLGALLALEHSSPRGDITACGLLIVSVATFSIGLAFLAGAAVSVLLREDRRRRVWIWIVPLVLYVLWYFAAPKYSGPGYLSAASLRISNVLLVPRFIADSAAAVASAITGLGYDFSTPGPTVLVNYSLGPAVAAVAALALALRLRRSQLRRSFWTYLTIPLVFWVSIVMVIGPNRYPNSTRYMYAGAVGVLLLAAEAMRGTRPSRRALLVLFTLMAVALGGNIAEIRVNGANLRRVAAIQRAIFTAIDLARDHVAPDFLPSQFGVAVLIQAGGGTGTYLAAARRTGPLGYTLPELRHQPERVRELTDSTLVAALRIGLTPTPLRRTRTRCLSVNAPAVLTIRSPGAVLRSATRGELILGRFGSSPSVDVGSLSPNRLFALAIPRDRAPQPWHASFPVGQLTVCPLSA